jgi:uncharacterized protein
MKCPTCRKDVTVGQAVSPAGPGAASSAPYAPFCSERCRLIDLGNWAAEKYRVAAETQSEPEGEPADED